MVLRIHGRRHNQAPSVESAGIPALSEQLAGIQVRADVDGERKFRSAREREWAEAGPDAGRARDGSSMSAGRPALLDRKHREERERDARERGHRTETGNVVEEATEAEQQVGGHGDGDWMPHQIRPFVAVSAAHPPVRTEIAGCAGAPAVADTPEQAMLVSQSRCHLFLSPPCQHCI